MKYLKSRNVVRYTTLSSICALVLGCSPSPTQTNYYYRPNTIVQQKVNDFLDCQLEGVQSVPSNQEFVSRDGYKTPTTCQRDASGNTFCTGGNTVGGGVSSFDNNALLRSRTERRCMQRRGYILSQAYVRPCGSGEVPIGYAYPYQKVLSPSPDSCFVRYEGVKILYRPPYAPPYPPAGAYTPGVPAGAYTPGVPAGAYTPGVPAGAYTPGVPAGAYTPGVPAGAYTPGVPAGAYTPGVPAGAYTPGVPAGAYMPGVPAGMER
ncbi:MAG: hypothetical protein PSN37_01520 [Alphaproteobacteria bacterium]|nr:hypothetical protein [Alphaproteobacteria bacterium]